MPMYFSLLLVLVFTVRVKDCLMLKGPDQVIFASAGEEAILNCSADFQIRAHEIEEVTWKKKDGDVLILLFQDNETFADASHESYRGRVEFFITEIPKGNFSLKLRDVKMEDRGEFLCEVHTSNLSARAIVVLSSVGFSMLHITTLVLCFLALLITVGFCFTAIMLLRKKVTNRTRLLIQAPLMICPNICMCVAFILWSKEGFLHEVVTCSAICATRPIMLMKTSPYLNTLPVCLQKAVRVLAVPLYHILIVMAAYSILFDNISKAWIAFEHMKTILPVAAVLCFICAVISAGFALRMHLTLLLETINALLLALFVQSIREYFHLRLQIVSVLPPLLKSLMMVLSVQHHCFQGKPLKCLQIALSSFLVILYSVIQCYIYAVLVGGRMLLFEAVIFIIVWLAVVFLLRSPRKEYCSLQRGEGYACCAFIAMGLIIAFGAFCLHYTAKIMRNTEDGAGYLALNVLIHVLAATALFKHPKHLPDLPHIMIYMFGAVGLTVINSITLASELFLKAAKGARTVEDLRVIVIPFEAAFVFGWLALQTYDAWIRTKDRIKHNFADRRETRPEVLLEMEPLPT